MSPSSFKFKVMYRGQWYYGNSIDTIANRISLDHNLDFNKTVSLVNKGIVPHTPNKAKPAAGKQPSVKKNLSLEDVFNGAKSVLKQIGGDTASSEDIRSRSIICSTCPNKTEVSGCSACGFAKNLLNLANYVKKIFNLNTKVPNALEKYYCNSCECSLAVMIPAASGHFKDSAKKDLTRPDSCWVKKL